MSAKLVAFLALLSSVPSITAVPSPAAADLELDHYGRPLRSFPGLEGVRDHRERIFQKHQTAANNVLKNLDARSFETAAADEKRSYELKKRQSGGRTVTVELKDQYQITDIQWTGNVTVGTPPQQYVVLFDTGSSDDWLSGPGSVNGAGIYDPAASSTYRNYGQAVSLTYGKGVFNGTLGTDRAGFADLQVDNATVSVGRVDGQDFSGAITSGIFGFAFPIIAGSGSPNLISTLVANNALATPQFGVYLNRGLSAVGYNSSETTQSVGGGSMILGGSDSSHYSGSLERFPTVTNQHWTIASDGIVIDGELIPNTAAPAAIDTGTSFIYLPDTALRAVLTALGSNAGVDQSSGNIYAPCSSLPQNWGYRFTGSNTVFNLAYEDLVNIVASGRDLGLKITDPLRNVDQICLTVFGGGQTISDYDITTRPPTPLQPFHLIGDAFLKNWYQVYDFGGLATNLTADASVSFAQAVPQSAANWNQTIANKVNAFRTYNGLPPNSNGTSGSSGAATAVRVGSSVVVGLGLAAIAGLMSLVA